MAVKRLEPLVSGQSILAEITNYVRTTGEPLPPSISKSLRGRIIVDAQPGEKLARS